MHSSVYDNNSYWVMPRCPVLFLIIKRWASRDLALCPTSDFDPQGVWKIYNMKSSCNYDTINNLFYQKIALFMILLQFWTILLPYKLCVTEKRTYINKGCNLENPYLLTVFSAVPYLLPNNVSWFLVGCSALTVHTVICLSERAW